MIHCDAIVVGGGPAGSSCARRLHDAGWNVVVLDRAQFPRDKVCAGWLTADVFPLLDLTPAEYRASGAHAAGDHRIPHAGDRPAADRNPLPADDQLRDSAVRVRRLPAPPLGRARVRQHPGLVHPSRRGSLGRSTISSRPRSSSGPAATSVPSRATCVEALTRRCRSSPRKRSSAWTATGARWPRSSRNCCSATTSRDTPGACARRATSTSASAAAATRISISTCRPSPALLDKTMNIRTPASVQWRGHAYLAWGVGPRPVVGDGMLLAGDAAGLAYPESGEGIRPAIESGQMAAAALIGAGGRYSADALRRTQRPWSACTRRESRDPGSATRCRRRWAACCCSRRSSRDMSSSIAGFCDRERAANGRTERPVAGFARCGELPAPSPVDGMPAGLRLTYA